MNDSYKNRDETTEWVQKDAGGIPIRSVTTNVPEGTVVPNWEQLRLFR